MATERLNSILSHLTPGKSGLSAMYATFPAFSPIEIANNTLPQHSKEPRRCSHYPCHPDAPNQRFQRWPKRHRSRLHSLLPSQEGPREIEHRPTDDRRCLPRQRTSPSSLPQTPLTYTFTGQQRQGSLHLPRRLPRSRLPHYRRRLLRKPLLLLRPQSRPRYREPNKHRQH